MPWPSKCGLRTSAHTFGCLLVTFWSSSSESRCASCRRWFCRARLPALGAGRGPKRCSMPKENGWARPQLPAPEELALLFPAAASACCLHVPCSAYHAFSAVDDVSGQAGHPCQGLWGEPPCCLPPTPATTCHYLPLPAAACRWLHLPSCHPANLPLTPATACTTCLYTCHSLHNLPQPANMPLTPATCPTRFP